MADPWPGRPFSSEDQWPGTPVSGDSPWPGTPVEAERAAVDPSTLESNALKDTGAALVRGAGGLLQLPEQVGNLITRNFGGPEGWLSRQGTALQEFGQGMKSPQLLERERQAAAAIKEAEARGLGPEIMAALRAYAGDPRLLLNFTVEQLPQLIPSLGAGLLTRGAVSGVAALAGRAAPATATLQRAAVAGAIGTGATQQGASVADDTYKDVMGLPIEQMRQAPAFISLVQSGLSEDQARDQLASQAAQLAGAASGAISLGTAAALPGVEKTVLGPQAVKQGIIRRVLGAALGEAGQEAIEESGGRTVQNIAASEFDPARRLTQGAGAAGVMGGLAGGLTGGGAAGVRAFMDRRAATQDTQPPSPEADVAPERIEPPRGLPPVDASLNIDLGAGPVAGTVLEYVRQGDEVYAVVAAGEARVPIPVSEFARMYTDAPDSAAAERADEEPSTEDIEPLVAGEGVPAEPPAPPRGARRVDPNQRTMDVDTDSQRTRVENVPEEKLRAEQLRLQEALSRYSQPGGQEDAANKIMLGNPSVTWEQAVERAADVRADVQSRLDAVRAELARRATASDRAPELDPLSGIVPLLYNRPLVSEADVAADPALQAERAKQWATRLQQQLLDINRNPDRVSPDLRPILTEMERITKGILAGDINPEKLPFATNQMSVEAAKLARILGGVQPINEANAPTPGPPALARGKNAPVMTFGEDGISGAEMLAQLREGRAAKPVATLTPKPEPKKPKPDKQGKLEISKAQAKRMEGTSILERIRQMGGVRADSMGAGDAARIVGGGARAVSVLRLSKNGLDLDRLRGALAAEGYTRWDGKPLTNVDDLVETIGEEHNSGTRIVAADEVGDLVELEANKREQVLRDQYGDDPNADDVAAEDAADVADMHEAANERAFDAYNNGEWELEPASFLDEEGGDFATPSPENISLEDLDVARGSTQEQPAPVAEVPGAAGKVEPEAGASSQSDATREAPRASGETQTEGTTFEPAPESVEGGGEQGVVPGAEQKPEESAQAQEKAERTTEQEIARLKGEQSKMRSNKPQRDAGGMFGGDEPPPTMFERQTEQVGDATAITDSEGNIKDRRAAFKMVLDLVREIAGTEVKVRVADAATDPEGNPVYGAYDPVTKTILVSMGSANLPGTARHEVIHFLRDIGLFNDAQWASLTDMAKSQWREKHGTDTAYTKENVRNSDGSEVTPERLEEVRNEEAIAAAYGEWSRGDRTVMGRVRQAFERMREFYNKLRAKIYSLPYNDYKAIFRDIDNGRFAEGADKAVREQFIDAQAGVDANLAGLAADAERLSGNEALKREAQAITRFSRDPNMPSGPRWLSGVTRMLSFPLGRAASDKQLAAALHPHLEANKRNSAIVSQTYDILRPSLEGATAADKKAVMSALELSALNGQYAPVVNGRVTIRNETGKIATMTGNKKIVRLTPEQTKQYTAVKDALAHLFDANAKAIIARAIPGYNGPMTAKGARAEAASLLLLGKKPQANDAETVAEILEGLAARKRDGYFPAMREGDTSITVRGKIAPEFRELQQEYEDMIPDGEDKGFLSADALDRRIAKINDPVQRAPWEDLRARFKEAASKRSKVVGGPEAATVAPDLIYYHMFNSGDPILGSVIGTSPASAAKRQAAEKAKIEALMQKRGLKPEEYEIVVNGKAETIRTMMDDQSIPVFEKLVWSMSDKDPRTFKTLWEKYIEAGREDLVAGFRRKSNVVPGFSTDMADSLVRYTHTVARAASRMEYRTAIDDAMNALVNRRQGNALADPAAVEYMKRLAEYNDNPGNDFQALKSFGYFYYLAGVPSTAVQNLTQIPMIGIPQITALLGTRGAGVVAQAWGHAMKAVRIGRDGVKLDPAKLGVTEGEKAFLKRMDEEGQLTATVTRDLMGRDIDVGPELQAAHGFWKRTGTIMSSMFDAAESLNRATMLLAGYRAAQLPGAQEQFKKVYAKNENFKAMADKNGMISPEAFGEFLSREVNFEGQRINKPEALRGVGGVILQFKSYPMNYISLLRRNATQMGPEGKMAVAGMVGMLMLGAGVAGLPFAQDATDAYDKLMAMLGDDPQTMASLQAWLSDTGLGKLMAEILVRGGGRAALGIDTSATLGQGNIAPRMSSPIDLLGPTAGAILGGPYNAWQRYHSGQGAAAVVSELAPRAVKGPLTGLVTYPTEGVVSRSGKAQVLLPEELTMDRGERVYGDQIKRTLGFTPAQVPRRYEAIIRDARTKKDGKDDRQAMTDAIGRLYAQANSAGAAGNAARAAQLNREAQALIEEAARRGIRLNAQSIRSNIARKADPLDGGLRTAPKEKRGEMGSANNPFPAGR